MNQPRDKGLNGNEKIEQAVAAPCSRSPHRNSWPTPLP